MKDDSYYTLGGGINIFDYGPKNWTMPERTKRRRIKYLRRLDPLYWHVFTDNCGNWSTKPAVLCKVSCDNEIILHEPYYDGSFIKFTKS